MKRLESLDIMRGLTGALMILVNTALWGTPVYGQLGHSLWNGMTAADLVFPMFMFIMGVSVSFSLKRFNYSPGKAAVGKILKRTMLIYIIGLALDLVEKGISGAIDGLDFSTLRFTGVLPRLAFSYGIASLMALYFSRRALWRFVVAMLTVYAVILLAFKGFEPTVENIVSRVDVAVFGQGHIYHDWVPGGRIPLDPEGLFGLLPSVAHVLIGYLCGRILLERSGMNLTPLLLVGALLTILGLGLDSVVPINKKVWSPTFVLVSCGLGISLLGLLIYAVDFKKTGAKWLNRVWMQPAEVFGANPLFLYILSSLLGCVMWRIEVGGMVLPHYLYVNMLEPVFGPESAMPSLIYASGITAVCYLVGLPLYLKKIYIKI